MNAPIANPIGTDLIAEINRLKKERNAVILGHYYQSADIQEISDFAASSSWPKPPKSCPRKKP
jgi:quinolinate synthase